MFIGEYQHNLDSKGRLAIPAKFRDRLTGGAIITRGLDHCLFVFTSKEWEVLAQKLIALMLAGAMDVEIDKQGRILTPDYLRKYAGLKKQVAIAGLYNRIEIWDSEKWQDYKNKTEGSSDEIAEKLGELGI